MVFSRDAKILRAGRGTCRGGVARVTGRAPEGLALHVHRTRSSKRSKRRIKGYCGVISKGKFSDGQRRSRGSATLPVTHAETPTRRHADTPTRRHADTPTTP